jgi:hypothetical protein
MTPDQGAATLSAGETSTTWEWVDNGNGRKVYRPVTHQREDAEPTPDISQWAAFTTDDEKWSDLELSPPQDQATVITADGTEVPAPAVPTDSTNTKLRRLIYLKARVKTMEAEIKAHKAEAAELDAEIRADWSEEGQNSATLEGKTAYLFPVYHVENTGDNGPADIRAALEESGLGHMLQPNYSASALKAYLKELRERGEQPPDALAAVCSLHLTSEVRIRDAATRTVPVVY